MKKIELLREKLKENKISAFIVPKVSRFLDEYMIDSEKRLDYISGFNGSAGVCIVTNNKAAIFVDGRYTLQVRSQTDSSIFEYGTYNMDSIMSWLASNLKAGDIIGVDASLISIDSYKNQSELFKQHNFEIKLLAENPVDSIWKDKPTTKGKPLRIHPIEYAGVDSGVKCDTVAKIIKQKNADSLLITSPDNIMWLLNLRGNDVKGATFAYCFAVISSEGVIDVFLDTGAISTEIRGHTPKARYHNESEMPAFLKNLATQGKKIIAPASTTAMIFQLITDNKIILEEDFLSVLKAVKNHQEILHMQRAQHEDALTFVKIIHYIKTQAVKDSATEVNIVNKINEIASQNQDYIEPSFNSIVGIDKNAAIIHYHPTEATTIPIKAHSIVLVDRGGQYKYGTTDITRTVSVGNVSAKFKRFYTLVLKGHIAISMARLPKGATGAQLDAMARQYLWQDNYDYNHGTGHGLGAAGAVHEAPFGIHKYSKALVPNTILTNEPGAYFENEFGIRIEDDILLKEVDNSFMAVQSLTCVPFDRESIALDMLSPAEINYINDYHKNSYKILSGKIQDTSLLKWLEEITKPL